MASAKKEPETNEASVSMEEVRAEIQAMLEAARQEAASIVEQAKQATGGEKTNGRMSPEELRAYNAYMNEYVEVELFKDNGKYKDDVFVGVNGENCLIKRGERVKIKRKFAQVLERSMAQNKEAAKYMEAQSGQWEKARAALN